MRRQNGRSRKKNMAKVSLRNIKKVYPNSAPKKKAKDQPEKKHNLQITDEGVVAVQEFNLDIADKEFIVLVGPSGCGKSTTLRMIAGLEDITAGELYIGDKLMNDVAPKDRDIAMVFQNYALYPHMTVYENMAFSLKLKKTPKDEIDRKVKEAAEILDITQYLDRKPKALSGGQRQRVAIGRAIVRNPAVFLMDEPLSNLDAKLRVEMRNAIKRIQRQFGITTVYVTHDQEEALAVSDRIAVMNGGVIQQIDAPHRIYQRPTNRFVSNFIGLSNFLEAAVSRKDGKTELIFKDGGYRVPMAHLSGDAKDGEKVLAAVRPEEFLFGEAGGEGIPAKVRSCVFLGNGTHYFLTLPSGQEIEAIRDSDEWTNIPDGTAVTLRVKPNRINVFTADGDKALVIREELL